MIKIGLIGFGKWVNSAYLPALRRDGRAVVTAVAASSENTRQKALQTLGDDICVFENYEELLLKADVDAVMLALPDRLHHTGLAAVLKSGIPVFYEPPVSNIRSQIPVMAESLLAAEQVTYANLELCSQAAIGKAAEMIKEGAIGALQNITLTLHAGWGWEQNSDICMLDRLSCWYVDVLNRIAGTMPSRVMSLDGHGVPGRMQPVSMGIYDYHGVWGIFRVDVTRSSRVSITIEAAGSDGDIFVDYFSGELRVQAKKASAPEISICCAATPYASYPGVHETVSAFLDAVSSGDRKMGNAGKVAQLCRIGLAVEESKDTGDWVRIKK